MNRVALSLIAALALLSPALAFDENPPSQKIDGSKPFVLVGSLGEAKDDFADDVWTPYADIYLYGAVDILCPETGSTDCVSSQDNLDFRLDIPESLQWAYRQNIDSVVTITATTTGNPPVNGQTSLNVTALTPVTVGTNLTTGQYVSDKRHCDQNFSEHTDSFLEIIVSYDGSIASNGWESTCTALSSEINNKKENIVFGCFSEGMAFTISESINLLPKERFEFIDDFGGPEYSLCSFEEQFPYSSAAPDLIVDLRRPHADEISYGSRIGMNAALVQLSGVDTDSAELVSQIMPLNAHEFCAFYGNKSEPECISEELGLNSQISRPRTANCSSGYFTNISGERRKFLGLSSPGDYTEFAIIDISTGNNLVGSPAYIDLELFETLCPSRVAELLDRPKARPKLATENYPAAFDALDYWKGRRIGVSNPNGQQLADLPIWQFATRMRSERASDAVDLLKSAELKITGHLGFVSAQAGDSASLLIDFAQQEIYLCVRLLHSDRPVSYRFGTPLSRGIDGFGSACPSSLSAALGEYLPLIGSDQELAWAADGPNFSAPWPLEGYADFLGLGEILAEYACFNEMDEDDPRRFWYHFGGNWYYAGNMGATACRVEESTYAANEGSIQIVAICGAPGWEFGTNEFAIPRPPTSPQGTFHWAGTPMKQCSNASMNFAPPQPRQPPVMEPVYKRNGMQDWADVSSGAVYQVGEYSFSFFTTGADDRDQVLSVAVTLSGSPTTDVNLPTSLGGAGAFGIYNMGEDATPTLVIASFLGGAHCCTEYAFLPLTPEPSQVSFAGSFDGDYWDLWDIDRDGSFELARPDIRFEKALGPYLGLFAPPIVFAMENGTIADATSAARYQPYLRDKSQKASQYCGTADNWAIGACEGWAATAYRLGEYDTAMASIAERFAAAPHNTSMGVTSFAVFTSGLEASLRNLGVWQEPPEVAGISIPTSPLFDDLTCSFTIKRHVLSDGNRGEIASGTFDINQDRIENLKGSWATVGASDAFADADLFFGPDGGLHGNLTVYPLFARDEMPRPFPISLDGTASSGNENSPEGVTSFHVDHGKIEILMEIGACSK